MTPVGLVAKRTLVVFQFSLKYNPRWGNGRSRAQWEKNPTCLASMNILPFKSSSFFDDRNDVPPRVALCDFVSGTHWEDQSIHNR